MQPAGDERIGGSSIALDPDLASTIYGVGVKFLASYARSLP
jgi:hypothetical protein